MIKIGETYSSGSFDDDNEYCMVSESNYQFSYQPDDKFNEEFVAFVLEESIDDIADYLDTECIPGWFDLYIDGEQYANSEYANDGLDYYRNIEMKDGWCSFWFKGNPQELQDNDLLLDSIDVFSTFEMAEILKNSAEDGLEIKLKIYD